MGSTVHRRWTNDCASLRIHCLIKRRPHLPPRYKVSNSPLRCSRIAFAFAASAQAVVTKSLHVVFVEYVYRHIPSSTFRHVSVVLSLSTPSCQCLSFCAFVRVYVVSHQTSHVLVTKAWDNVRVYVWCFHVPVPSRIRNVSSQTLVSSFGSATTPVISVLSSKNLYESWTFIRSSSV